MKKAITLTAGAAVTMFLLAGCTPIGSIPFAGGTPEPAPTVTVARDTDEPDRLRIYVLRGKPTMGSTWAEMSSQLHYPVAGIDEPWNDQVLPTLWPRLGDRARHHVRFHGRRTGRVLLHQPSVRCRHRLLPRNAEGVGVGSTEAQVLAAFPTAVVDNFTDRGRHSQDHRG